MQLIRPTLLVTTTLLLALSCSGDDGTNSDGLSSSADASLDDDRSDDDVTRPGRGDDDAPGDDDGSLADDSAATDDDVLVDDDMLDDDVALDDDGSLDDDVPDAGGTGDDGGTGILDASLPAGGAGGSGGASGGDGGGLQTGGSGTGGSGTGGSAVGGGSSAGAGGQPPMCFPAGFSCQTSEECCSGLCDPANELCASVLTECTADGQDCSSPTECCSLACGGDGKCGSACVSDLANCTSDGECCGGTCTGGVCQPLNLECKTSGNECGAGTECCSKACGTDGRCDIAPSYCIQMGDICASGEDCCTGVCNLVAGKQIGTCGEPPQGAANCSGVHGTVCAGCGECCSSLCAPYGPTGAFICQPPSGCHVTGELCRENSDCCGGVPAEDYPNPEDALPGAGRVFCDIRDNNSLGVCRNSMGCSPQGNICHFQNYECSNSSAPNSCCGGTGNSGVCQLDFLGIPRCYGLDECRDAGEICSSAADCCNGIPCVPGDDGFLRCLTVDEGEPACVGEGDSCTTVSDCCPGTTCITALGSLGGVCGVPAEPPGSGGTGNAGTPGVGGEASGGTSAGGTSSGGTSSGGSATGGFGPGGAGGTPSSGGSPPSCSEYGQFCSDTQLCCNDVPCTAGRCIFPPN